MLTPLENKGYVLIEKSSSDARTLNVELTEKAYQYFSENDEMTACKTSKLFSAFSAEEIGNLAHTLKSMVGIQYKIFLSENDVYVKTVLKGRNY